jgi:hypothetical protein
LSERLNRFEEQRLKLEKTLNRLELHRNKDNLSIIGKTSVNSLITNILQHKSYLNLAIQDVLHEQMETLESMFDTLLVSSSTENTVVAVSGIDRIKLLRVQAHSIREGSLSNNRELEDLAQEAEAIEAEAIELTRLSRETEIKLAILESENMALLIEQETLESEAIILRRESEELENKWLEIVQDGIQKYNNALEELDELEQRLDKEKTTLEANGTFTNSSE